jgi:hypothetical protein
VRRGLLSHEAARARRVRRLSGPMIALVLAAVGCKDDNKDQADAADCTQVFTPGGPAGKACVHEVPNGASVEVTDAGVSIVTLDGKVVATYPPCPCPRAPGTTVGPMPAGAMSAESTVACGARDTADDPPCCPVSWLAGGSCDAHAASSSCWTECRANGADAGIAYRSQLVCQVDGTIGAGKGLFPCTLE